MPSAFTQIPAVNLHQKGQTLVTFGKKCKGLTFLETARDLGYVKWLRSRRNMGPEVENFLLFTQELAEFENSPN